MTQRLQDISQQARQQYIQRNLPIALVMRIAGHIGWGAIAFTIIAHLTHNDSLASLGLFVIAGCLWLRLVGYCILIPGGMKAGREARQDYLEEHGANPQADLD